MLWFDILKIVYILYRKNRESYVIYIDVEFNKIFLRSHKFYFYRIKSMLIHKDTHKVQNRQHNTYIKLMQGVNYL
jgi:hypothetical protein